MVHKFVFAGFALALGISLVAAEEYTARITKIDGDKVTFQKLKKGENSKFPNENDGDPVTLSLAKDAKFVKAKFAKADGKFKLEPGDPIEGGLKADAFKITEKGPVVRITTTEDKKQITEIMTFGFGGGFKDKKGKDKKDAPAKDAKDAKDAPAKDAKDK